MPLPHLCLPTRWEEPVCHRHAQRGVAALCAALAVKWARMSSSGCTDPPPVLCTQVGSPYCFLCERPQRLAVLHPLRGQHKLWRLDKKVGVGEGPGGGA